MTALEAAQLINSADAVYQRAEDAGRFASRRSATNARHQAGQAALNAILLVQNQKAKP